MRWSGLMLSVYLALVLQVGLGPHLVLGGGALRGEPQFQLILIVFFSLFLQPRAAMTIAALTGAMTDLATVYSVVLLDPAGQAVEKTGVVLLGPYVLGYLAGSYLVVHLRPMLLRQHPMTLAMMTLVGGAAVYLVVLVILTTRMWYEPIWGFSAKAQLVMRLGGLVYSGALALLLSRPLAALAPWWGIAPAKTFRPSVK